MNEKLTKALIKRLRAENKKLRKDRDSWKHKAGCLETKRPEEMTAGELEERFLFGG